MPSTTPADVGNDLLAVPFPQMVAKLAEAIAIGQLAMDLESVKILNLLVNTNIPGGTVPAVIDESDPTSPVIIYYPDDMPLLVYGIKPNFYQFTNAVIQVKMAISMVETTKTSQSTDNTFTISDTNKFNVAAGGGILSIFGGPSVSDSNKLTVAYVSTYDAKYSNKYQFNEQGTSQLSININPVPPPQLLTPSIIPPPPPTKK